MAATLYKRQREILNFIKKFVAKNQAAPTLQEIADNFGLSSLATVHAHLQRLEEKGYIIRDYHGERGIEVVDPSSGPLFRDIVELPVSWDFIPEQPLSQPAAVEYKVIPVDWIGNKDCVCIRVHGWDLKECLYADGDILLVEQKRKPSVKAIVLGRAVDGGAHLGEVVSVTIQTCEIRSFKSNARIALPVDQLVGSVIGQYRLYA
ncbi:MAG TPA: winged helix-turn-helix transcriptional regulator [bacterium]|nr:winged helix-turn-helix transcriptional regulator [bacterium]